MKIHSIVTAVALSAGAAGAQVIDGVHEAAYGGPIVVQNTQTEFGNSTLGQSRYANGSELDAGYAYVRGGNLYLLLAGNLESNFNKLDLFIDSRAGGQSTLRGDNPDVDFNGLNRMAGLTFTGGFAADYWFSTTGGGDPYGYYVNGAELLTTGGGAGGYLGSNDGSGAPLSGGANPFGIQAAIDNSNTAGVSGGNGLDSGLGVLTGMEFCIPLAAIGAPTDRLCIIAFINGGGHDFVSNQVLGGIGGGGNLGDPANVNLAATGAACFEVLVPAPGALSLLGLAGLAAARRRR